MSEKIVLVTGGLDSTISSLAFLPTYKKVFFNGISKYSEAEQIAVEKIFEKNLSSVTTIDLPKFYTKNDIFVPARNLTLVSLAVSMFNAKEVVLSGVKDDRVCDKNNEAYSLMQNVLNEFCDEKGIKIFSPLSEYTKGEAVEMYLDIKKEKETLLNTFSCYYPIDRRGSFIHCMACPACLRRWVALVSNFIQTPQNPSKEYFVNYLIRMLATKADPDRIHRTFIAAKTLFNSIVAIDYDNTIVNKSNIVKRGMRAYSRDKSDRGNNLVVVYTARPETDRKFVEENLYRQNFYFDCLVLGKLPFSILVDDCSFQKFKQDS